MAIWKEQSAQKSDSAAMPQSNNVRIDEVPVSPLAPSSLPLRQSGPTAKESLIAADLTIEGKVEGAGHIRMAGRFKGDVNVDGNLTIESGAKVTGSVRARTVVIGGELEGNIDAASHVELLDTGVLNGDLRAGSFVVASGSRMRGQVAFGWNDDTTNIQSGASKPAVKKMEVLSSS